MWEKAPLSERDALVPILKSRDLIPDDFGEFGPELERTYGLYPDLEDPDFTQKLLQKREFSESRQPAITDADFEKNSACDPEGEFELTAVQRFVSRLLSPECPYYSALLYHGVGVGKTCAAITIAESHLRVFSRKQVFIVAPRTIQAGFRRTIFDDEALVIPEEGSNIAKGCTGNSYLKRTGSEYERERGAIARRVTQAINARYRIMGYLQFSRYIEDIIKQAPKDADGKPNGLAVTDLLRREFSGRLVIIDEAHNLRDNPKESAQENLDTPDDIGEAELSDSQAGKRLTPRLHNILEAADGMKLVLLSGTPMYNSQVEIIFLLNLILRNEKKATISEKDIFDMAGAITPDGRRRLGAYASRYVSFMRGENPLTFPVRLYPKKTMDAWPSTDLQGNEIADKQRQDMVKLPFIDVSFEGEALEKYTALSEAAAERGLTLPNLDEMAQKGNWIFPEGGFDDTFDEVAGATLQYRARGDAKWLLEDELKKSSPKAAFTLQRAATCSGIVFVYSRFIKSGATPLALALEANGYTAWNRDKPLFADGIQDNNGRQCAICPFRERDHGKQKHRLVPAKYILVTGQAGLSPNNAAAIQAARAKSNINGGEVKVIIGSQVASEGVDFRFVREIYVFDSWFHLNKMEQVLGRGIRTCSHALLPVEKRNCMIHLLVNAFEGNITETADMYMYRTALQKAALTGNVTRVLKEYAIDCNLNRDAIVISGLKERLQVDSQGASRKVRLDDTPFTNICDWIETCDYKCKIPINTRVDDISTYDEYAAKKHETQLKQAIKTLFEVDQQTFFSLDTITEMFSSIPPRAISSLLMEIVGNQSFRIKIRNTVGYIAYRNGYYVFQPIQYADTRIPLAMRIADVPVKRDFYDPRAVLKAASGPRVVKAEDIPVEQNGTTYWEAVVQWSEQIRIKEAPIDIPPDITTLIKDRYKTDDDRLKEKERFVMVTWMYQDMRDNPEYESTRDAYLQGLSTALLEFVWDESLTTQEQYAIYQSNKATKGVYGENVISTGGTTAFRYIDVLTGNVKYLCSSGACSDAVSRVFEATSDSISGLKVTPTTTAPIYGFMVPKGKEKALVFKTSSPPKSGTKPEKGGECAIVSTITHHVRMLMDIAEIMKGVGYKTLLLRTDVLEEKKRRKELKPSGPVGPTRHFENTMRACALKDLVLRWLDIMERSGRGLRFFYRPLAALRSGHKGTFTKA